MPLLRLTLIISILYMTAWAPGAVAGRIYVGIPVSFEFDAGGAIEGTAQSVTGIILGYGFDFNVGLGAESYAATIDDETSGVKTDVAYSFIDLFAWVRTLGLDWQVGYGIGDVKFDSFSDNGGNTYSGESGDATQWFITAGLPFSKNFTVHAGYHKVSAESDVLINDTTPDTFDLSGQVISLGVQYVFDGSGTRRRSRRR